MLKKHWKLISLIAVVCLALCIGAVATRQAMNGETEVSIDKVPAAVRATIEAEAKGGTIKEVEIETVNDQTVYEADVIIDGQEVEIQVAPDGTLLSKETEDDDEDDEGDDDDDDEVEIPLSEVPAEALKAAQGAVDGITITEAEMEKEDGQTVYELEGKANGKEYEIEVTAEGKVLEVEEETEDDEEDDDD